MPAIHLRSSISAEHIARLLDPRASTRSRVRICSVWLGLPVKKRATRLGWLQSYLTMKTELPGVLPGETATEPGETKDPQPEESERGAGVGNRRVGAEDDVVVVAETEVAGSRDKG